MFEVSNKIISKVSNKVVLKVYDETIKVIIIKICDKVYNRIINEKKIINVEIIEVFNDFNFLKVLIKVLMCLTYFIKI